MVTSLIIELEPLRTILKVECQRGYANTAVIGGLDKYLFNWFGQNRSKVVSPEHLARFEELGLSTFVYATLDKERRKSWINDFLLLLSEVERTTTAIPQNRKKAHSKVARQKARSSSFVNPAITITLDSSVTAVKGIKDSLAAKLGKLSVKTVRDLLYFFPRHHLDYSQRKCIADLVIGEEQTILAKVWEARVVKLGGREATEVTLGDETGNIRAVWFNNPYLAKRFSTNVPLVISGRVAEYRGRLVFESPEWELFEDRESIHAGRLVPVYPLTSGLYPRQLRSLMKKAIDDWAGQLQDFLPVETKERCQLLDLPKAIIQAHFPDDYTLKDAARKRLAFDELLLIQLGVLRKKRDWQEGQPGNAFALNMGLINNFLSSLPFTLTHAQERVLQEILSDLQRTKPMSRLLQGEVGSGKTVIAMAALIASVNSGYQGALMAPTEILADQHYHNICRLLLRGSDGDYSQSTSSSCDSLFSHPVTFSLLTGKLSEQEKLAIQQRICGGRDRYCYWYSCAYSKRS